MRLMNVEKEFQVNAADPNKMEALELLVRAVSLHDAVDKLRYSTVFQLPRGSYYVYEAGHDADGVSVALPPHL